MDQLRMLALPNHSRSALYGAETSMMACQLSTKVLLGLSLSLIRPNAAYADVPGNLVIAARDRSNRPSSNWCVFEKTNHLVDAPAQCALSAPAQMIIGETSVPIPSKYSFITEVNMRPSSRSTLIIFFSLILAMSLPSPLRAEEGAVVDGAGFSLFDTESIKGFDAEKVERDPVCDLGKRPRITKVEPDDVKPGDKVVISGENFGTKECFHTVTFSASPEASVDYKFVNDSTIEVTVPDAKAGMSFVIIVAGGGSAQSKPLLIHSK